MISRLLDSRERCPCCGFPTLSERAAYEICELCNWEDDGQDDENADEVWGGPNRDYSLTKARANFKRFRVMYEPGRDQRITGGDSRLEYRTKGELMELFRSLAGAGPGQLRQLEADIRRLELVLQQETARQIAEWEKRNEGA